MSGEIRAIGPIRMRYERGNPGDWTNPDEVCRESYFGPMTRASCIVIRKYFVNYYAREHFLHPRYCCRTFSYAGTSIQL